MEFYKAKQAVEISKKDWDWITNLLKVRFDDSSAYMRGLIEITRACPHAEPYAAFWQFDNNIELCLLVQSTSCRYYADLIATNKKTNKSWYLGPWNLYPFGLETIENDRYEWKFIIKEDK